MNIYFGITFQIRKYRCLWDMNSSKNEDRNVRSNAWNELSDVFNKEGKQKKTTSAFDSLSIFLSDMLRCFLRHSFHNLFYMMNLISLTNSSVF